jgi:hypothetical protein
MVERNAQREPILKDLDWNGQKRFRKALLSYNWQFPFPKKRERFIGKRWIFLI